MHETYLQSVHIFNKTDTRISTSYCWFQIDVLFYLRNSLYHSRPPPVRHDAASLNSGFLAPVITGLRIEEGEKGVEYDNDGAPLVLAGSNVIVFH